VSINKEIKKVIGSKIMRKMELNYKNQKNIYILIENM